MAKSLKDLQFVDLYIGTDYAELKGLKGSPNKLDPVPDEFKPSVNEVYRQCRFRYSASKDPEFSLAFDGVVYRVTVICDVTDDHVFILRRTTAEVRPIEKLGLPGSLVMQMLDQNLKGLVLVAGDTGAGKTSTIVSLLLARMNRHGGVGITIEDPPEVHLNGPQGKGRITQLRASRRMGGYKEHLMLTLRSNPDIIMLGEVREAEAAAVVVNAAINGHLILSTIHAGGVGEAINRLAQAAASARHAQVSVEDCFRSLASGLRMVIWQKLEPGKNGGPPKFSWEALSLAGDNAQGARSKIASGNIAGLVHDIDQQMRQWKHAAASATQARKP